MRKTSLVTFAVALGSLYFLVTSPLSPRFWSAGWLLAIACSAVIGRYCQLKSANLGPAGTFAQTSILSYPITILFGPWGLLFLRLIWANGKTPATVTYNIVQSVLHGSISAAVFWKLHSAIDMPIQRAMIAHSVAIVVHIVSNLVLVAIYKQAEGIGSIHVLKSSFYHRIVPLYVQTLVFGAICMEMTHVADFWPILGACYLVYSRIAAHASAVQGTIGRALTIESLLHVIDARDRYTKDHSERVAGYVRCIAKKMGFEGERLHDIELAARLHDIGKIGLPDHILGKTGRLTEEEYERMKEHSLRGQQILAGNPQLAHMAKMVGQHHERYDGRGYAMGLSGPNICLEARIIAVADSFDAMTTDRPYHKARSIEDALEELQRCAGTQFDPEVVLTALACHGIEPSAELKPSPHSAERHFSSSVWHG